MDKVIVAASAIALALVSGFASAAKAEIAVAANDGKQIRGAEGVTKDSVAIIAFGSHDAPKVIGSINVPASMIGPPVSVVVAPDYSYAIVTGAQKLDAAGKLHPEDAVSVIGLDDPTHPKLLETDHAGPGATGISLNRQANLALVAATGDDSVTVFTIADRHLTQAGKITLEPKSEPRDVVIAPDGKSAYVVRYGDGKITKLAINGTTLTRVLDIPVGVNPDGAALSADGRYLFNSNFGGAPGTTPKTGAITAVDLKTNKIVDAVEVGASPEHVVLSPDNKFLLSVVGNGSAPVKTAKNYDSVLGKLFVFGVSHGKLSKVAVADTGHACQGATFSDDGKTILLQCSVERDIETFHFDGKNLSRDASGTVTFESRPGAIATARSR